MGKWKTWMKTENGKHWEDRFEPKSQHHKKSELFPQRR